MSSNLILNDNIDSHVFNRVEFNNPKTITNHSIIGQKDLIARGDASGNPIRMDYSLIETDQSLVSNFRVFADRNAGLIVDLKFENVQYFGYIESFNISSKRTLTVTREEPDPTDPSTLIITTADETFADIDFSFVSLTTLDITDDNENEGLFLQ